MAVPAAIAVGGTLLSAGIQAAGQSKASRAEARASEANARFFDEQAKFNTFALRQQVKKFKRESDIFFGDQVSAFAKAGVDVSGSPLMQLALTKKLASDELRSIRKEGEFNIRLARLRAGGAQVQARDTRRSIPFQTAGTLLTGFGRAASTPGLA